MSYSFITVHFSTSGSWSAFPHYSQSTFPKWYSVLCILNEQLTEGPSPESENAIHISMNICQKSDIDQNLRGQINNIFHKNHSLGDTSTKFGTNDVHDLYFKKSTLPSKKFKMAAIFQNGRLVNPGNCSF